MLGHLGKGNAVQGPRLRVAEPDDAWVLSRIDEASFQDYLPVEAFRSLLWTAGLTIRIIRNEYGHSAGYIITEHGRGYVEIIRLAVRPIDRRAGLASMVIKKLQDNLPRSVQVIAKVDLEHQAMCCLMRKRDFYGRLIPQTDVVRFEWREPFSPK